jgi:hypothetical protein
VAASRVRDCVNAAVDALKFDTTLTTLLGSAKVYTHVKQGTPTPYTLVMGGDEIPWVVTLECSSFGSPATTDGGDSGGRQVDVLVQCVSTYQGSAEVDGVASRVMEVLTDSATWAAVTAFQLAEFVRNTAQPPVDLNADGVLWFVRVVTVRVSLS